MNLITSELLKTKYRDKFKESKWLYLGTDYRNLIEFENNILLKENAIDYYNIFKRIEVELKEKYIQYIDSLSEKFDSFKWWVSSVAEKNIVEENNLFLQLCFLKLVEKYADSDILIISDDIALLNTIHINFPKSEFLISTKENIFFDKLKKYYKNRIRFIRKYWCKNNTHDEFDSDKIYIALMSWVDNRNFFENKFKENYFGKLFDKLNTTKNFIFLPFILYTIQKKIALQKLEENKIKYIDIFSYYRKTDVVRAILKSLCSDFIFNKKFYFENFDISNLIKFRLLNDLIENRYAQYYLMKYSIKRLSEKKIKFERIIYPFENQPWEKVLCIAVRKFMAETKLIGYMHTITLPNLLSIFPGKYESTKYIVQPDKILTTGKLSRDELKRYYDESRVKENCALRYEYFFNLPQREQNQRKQKNILLTLSVDYHKSLVMFYKVYEAFKNSTDFNILVKGHPTYILSLDNFRVPCIPENFKIVDRRISELLVETDLVLNCESTSGLEALKMHIPVIELEIENFVTLSRLDECLELKITAKTATEIYNKTIEILNWSDEQRNAYFEKSDKFLEYCFNPVSEEYIEKFLKV